MNFHLLTEYFRYWLYCLDEHSLHSPFVYDLYTSVIKPKPDESQFAEIEEIRTELLLSQKTIVAESFGAVSTINTNKERKISNIARWGISQKKYSRLYFLLAQYFESKSIWELGTSLGVNTLYLSKVPDSKVASFEGCNQTLAVAKENFSRLQRSNIELLEGNIDETLPNELGKVRELDMVFFDANHRFESTVRYFEACTSKTHQKTLFIFDDIHWSAEMDKAWKYIIGHPLSRITLDLFHAGIVFFDPELPKQHFILKF